MHNGRLATLQQVLDFYVGVNGQVQFPPGRARSAQTQVAAVRDING